MKKIYAELSYGDANIAVLEVEEKPKSYKVISSKRVCGFYFGRTFKKDSQYLHDDFNSAFFYLENKAREVLQARKEKYEEALKVFNSLTDIAKKISKEEYTAEEAINELLGVTA